MATVYEVYLDDQKGNRIKLLTGWSTLEWGREVNDVGAFTLTFPEEQFDRDLWWGLDRRVEIWRKPQDGVLQLGMVGFCRYLERGHLRKDERYVTIKGPDANDLLPRRIVAFAAGSSQAEKSGYAGDVMKEFVTENLGASAGTGRDITDYGFSVQVDTNDGYSSVNKAASRKNLLKVLQDVAEISYNQGNPIYFDVVHPTPSTFQFRTYADQRGQDRTYPDGHNPILLAAELGNLRTPKLAQDWRKEGTYGYGGGQGEGAEREIVEISDTTRANASVFNRREFFFQGSLHKTTARLQDATRARLRDLRPVRKFTGEIVEVENTRFGKDFGFGDKLTALFDDEQYDVMVAAFVAKVTDDGETVTAKLEYLE